MRLFIYLQSTVLDSDLDIHIAEALKSLIHTMKYIIYINLPRGINF